LNDTALFGRLTYTEVYDKINELYRTHLHFDTVAGVPDTEKQFLNKLKCSTRRIRELELHNVYACLTDEQRKERYRIKNARMKADKLNSSNQYCNIRMLETCVHRAFARRTGRECAREWGEGRLLE